MSGLQARTRTNGEMTLQEDTIRKLKESLRGELILANDPGYDDTRSIWNAMIDRRPALIARCLGVADAVTCVNFAREHETAEGRVVHASERENFSGGSAAVAGISAS